MIDLRNTENTKSVEMKELTLEQVEMVSGAGCSWKGAGQSVVGGAIAGGVGGAFFGPGALAGAGVGALGGALGYGGTCWW